MTITVTMLQTRQGEGGVMWTAGNSYSATDAFGAYLITSNLATGTLPDVPVTGLSPAQVTATAALVSGAVIVNSRDGSNRATSYTVGGVTYTVTYASFGVSTISGAGQVMTVTRDASGLVTAVATV